MLGDITFLDDDGHHEREDVVAHHKLFLEEMEKYEKRMTIYSGDETIFMLT